MKARDNPWVKIFRWLSVGLVALLVLELILIIWSAWGGSDQREQRDDGMDTDGFLIEALPPIEEFQETVDRTVFSWNRRPQKGGEAARSLAVAGSELSSVWRLTGLVNTGESTYAIFSEVQGDRQVRVEEAMTLDGWTVDSVDTERIVLVKDAKQETHRLTVSEEPPRVVDESTGEDEVPAEDIGASADNAGESSGEPDDTADDAEEPEK